MSMIKKPKVLIDLLFQPYFYYKQVIVFIYINSKILFSLVQFFLLIYSYNCSSNLLFHNIFFKIMKYSKVFAFFYQFLKRFEEFLQIDYLSFLLLFLIKSLEIFHLYFNIVYSYFYCYTYLHICQSLYLKKELIVIMWSRDLIILYSI